MKGTIMNSNTIIGIGFFAIIGIAFFINHFFSKKAIVRRKLKKSIPKRISTVTNGEIAKIVGKVEIIDKPLTAPLSGRKCAYYYVLIEQCVSSGKSSHWEKLIEEEVSGTFGIRDDQYCAQIDSKEIKSYIVQDRNFSSGLFADPPEEILGYLKQHDVETENLLGFNKSMRFQEGILEDGETIAVLGKGMWESVAHDQWSDNYGKVLKITSADKMPVYLSDDPKTTISNPHSLLFLLW